MDVTRMRFLGTGFLTGLALFALWAWVGRPQTLTEPSLGKTQRLQSVSYNPLRGDENPHDLGRGLRIPKERLEYDLTLLAKRFRCIRLYSTVGSQDILPVAEKVGLKVLLGAWIGAAEEENRREIKRLIHMARTYRHGVEAVIVGNEVILRGDQTTLFLLLFYSLAYIFDSRYRGFMGPGFLFPVLSVSSLHTWGSGKARLTPQSIAMGAALILAGFLILLWETPLNIQSDLWVLLCLISGVALLSCFSWHKVKDLGRRIMTLRTVGLGVSPILVGLLGYLGRSRIIENHEVATACAAGSTLWPCLVRGLLLLTAVLARRPRIAMASLFIGLTGLVFYQVALGATTFVLSLVYLTNEGTQVMGFIKREDLRTS